MKMKYHVEIKTQRKARNVVQVGLQNERGQKSMWRAEEGQVVRGPELRKNTKAVENK